MWFSIQKDTNLVIISTFGNMSRQRVCLGTTQKPKVYNHACIIDHLTVVGLATWPLNGSEAGVDLVLIQTSLFLLCKSTCSYAN